MERDWKEKREGETVISIYCMRKESIFNKREKLINKCLIGKDRINGFDATGKQCGGTVFCSFVDFMWALMH